MRINGRFERVVANVQRFVKLRNGMDRALPLVRTTMVVTDATVHQVPDFAELWKPYADQITLQDLTWRTKLLDNGTWTNREKSAVAPVEKRSFLGHRLSRTGRLGIAPKSLERMKQRVRRITRRSRGVSLERMIAELNRFVSGWVMYFRYAAIRSQLRRLDSWLRRRLRCVRLKQCKGFAATVRFLRRLSIWERPARLLASSGKGWWRKAASRQAACGMSTAWLRGHGWTPLVERFDALQH